MHAELPEVLQKAYNDVSLLAEPMQIYILPEGVPSSPVVLLPLTTYEISFYMYGGYECIKREWPCQLATFARNAKTEESIWVLLW